MADIDQMTEEELKELGFEPETATETPTEAGTASYDDLDPTEMMDLGFEADDAFLSGSGVVEKEETPTMFTERKFDEGPEPSSLDAQAGMATTSESIYYGGEEGQRLKYREGELRTALSDEFLYETTSQEDIEAMKKELEEIEAEKQSKFDKISGENVTDMGALGKLISNDDGSTNYVPGPSVNEAAQLPLKFLSDTARGILGLPELIGEEGYQDIVPKVASDDEAVVVVSELAQLTVGGLGGLTAAQKAKKIEGIGEYIPGFLKLFGEKASKVKGATTVAGTTSSAVGAAVVADEDIQTLFGGDKEMTMAEAKIAALTEGMAFGVALKGLSYGGTAVSKIPGVRTLMSGLAKTFAMMTSTGKELDDKVMASLAERINNGVSDMAKATTPEEVQAAQMQMYNVVEDAIKARTGMSFDEFLLQQAEGLPAGTYVPTIGETLNEPALLRMYTGIRLSSSKDKAVAAMSEMFKGNEDKRLQAIVDQGEALVEQYAVTGKQAAEQARVGASQALEEEQAAIEAQRVARTGEIEAQTDVRLGQAQTAREQQLAEAERATMAETTALEEQTAKAMAEEEARIAATRAEQEAVIASAEQSKQGAGLAAQDVMEASPVAPANMDDLLNQVDESGIVAPISKTLREDIATKNRLAAELDAEYSQITVTTEDLADLMDNITNAAAKSNLIEPEAIRDAFKPVRRLVRAVTRRMPEEGVEDAGAQARNILPPDVEEEVLRLEKLLDAETDIVESLKIAKQISELIRKSGGGTPPPAGITEIGQVAEELPALTLKDLQDVSRMVSSQASDLKATSAAKGLGSNERYMLGDYLSGVNAELQSLIAMRSEGVETALEARATFDDFFQNTFAERWRTETGRKWQAGVFDPMNEADVAKAQERIVKVVSNPQASKEDIAQVKAVISGMDEATRIEFASNIAPRVAMDFARKNAALLQPKGEPMQTVAQAEQALRALDRYLAGTQRYWDILPEAKGTLETVRAELSKVVSGARMDIGEAESIITAGKKTIAETEKAGKAAITEAQKAGREAVKGAEQRGKETVRGIEAEAKETERALNKVQEDALAEVNTQLRNAQRKLDRSAFARLTEFEGEPAEYFARALNDPKRGIASIEELWDRAGKQGFAGPDGLTNAQRAIKESVAEALLSKAQTSVAKATESGQVSLAPLLDAVADKGTVANKIMNLVFEGDEAGMELFKRFGKAAASFRQTQAMKGVAGSPTAEKMATEAALMDLNRVIFGPLTQKARIANFITKVSMRMFGTEVKVAEAYARVMTDPTYSKKVIDKAAELKLEGMVPEEEAVSKAFLATYMSMLGYKEYEKASDPWLTLEEHYKSFSTGAETEEILSQ